MLLSEVMLQQTQVERVIPYWERFMDRWPNPAAFAATPFNEVLLHWQGLGYPRRARALWLGAAVVVADGWPDHETALRSLPGVGPYTARALLTLAFEKTCPPPLDVNIARVAARAALGSEPVIASKLAIESAIESAQPRTLSRRDYVFALFDVGALHCRARPACAGCPLAAQCRSRERLRLQTPPAPRRQSRYAGSTRQLRGALLEAALQHDGPLPLDRARAAVAHLDQAQQPDAVSNALTSLRHEGLID